MTFRRKFLYGLIIISVLMLGILGFLLGNLVQSSYLTTFNAQVEAETELIAKYFEKAGGIPDQVNDELLPLLRNNVTIINQQGEIIFDSNVEQDSFPSRHQNILKRITLEKASLDLEGFEIVEGESDFHYYWRAIMIDRHIDGYVVHSSELSSINGMKRDIWETLIIGFGVTMMGIAFIGFIITKRYSKSLEIATNVANELAHGNYRVRTSEKVDVESGRLMNSLNVLAKNLEEAEAAREMQEDRLETLIENLGSGVIFIDNKSKVTLINREFKQLFNINQNLFMYYTYYDVIEHEEIIHLIEEIFRTERSIKRQFELPYQHEQKHFEVYGAPIIGHHDEWNGILLIFHDITELKRLEQIRKDFVANVSHELKTPITSIKGFSETLLDGALHDKETLESFLTIILNESDRLQVLIQELLNLSKMEQQVIYLDREKVDIVPMISEISTMLSTRLQGKNIQLSIDGSDMAVVEGDYPRIKQVFINLMSNAVNYTPQNGKVHVKIVDEPEQVKVMIQDTGIGIHQNEIPRIFERFYRVDKARSRDSGGTGLGLSIVKHILEVHHGKIEVTSKLGEGTTFTVMLRKKLDDYSEK